MQLPEWVNRYVTELQFEDGGREPPGVDCWGLIRLIYRERYRIELPSYREGYTDTLAGREIERLVDKREAEGWFPVSLGDEREGDIVLLRVACRCPGRRVLSATSHVGIVLVPGFMLHAQRDLGIAVEQYRGTRWGMRVVGIARHERLADRCYDPETDQEAI